MGLMSLDSLNLEVLLKSGTSRQKAYAARILPLVNRHHLLLVTLLLSNAASMETLPIFLNKVRFFRLFACLFLLTPVSGVPGSLSLSGWPS
jgi:hypothetical protein